MPQPQPEESAEGDGSKYRKEGYPRGRSLWEHSSGKNHALSHWHILRIDTVLTYPTDSNSYRYSLKEVERRGIGQY